MLPVKAHNLETKAFPLPTSPRILCGSGLDFSEIIEHSIYCIFNDIDHMSVLY